MAIASTILRQSGTPITIKSSGGTAAITMTSVANNAARQSAKIDLGTPWAEQYLLSAEVELAATPTAGNTIDFFWAASPSGTAGTSNPAGVSGTDAAYSGYSSNLADSVKQLQFLGSLVVTAQATSTVQKDMAIAVVSFPLQYGSLVVYNRSGAAFHSSATNVVFTLTPIRPVQDA